MSGDKYPQSTGVLIARLRRVARFLDRQVDPVKDEAANARVRARANVCWQAAARLEELVTLETTEMVEARMVIAEG